MAGGIGRGKGKREAGEGRGKLPVRTTTLSLRELKVESSGMIWFDIVVVVIVGLCSVV